MRDRICSKHIFKFHECEGEEIIASNKKVYGVNDGVIGHGEHGIKYGEHGDGDF